jgi:glutathione S-transferase
MKLYVLPPSPRAFKVIALKNHLGLECELSIVDLAKGDQLTPEYIAMNPNKKMPVLEDDGFVLWESNAILFYLASKEPHSGLWPSDVKRQAEVLRWLAWESAHWDESVAKDRPSRVSYELNAAGPSTTRLHVVHDDFDGQTATCSGSVDGWPLMLSSLKSLLETGKPLATQ